MRLNFKLNTGMRDSLGRVGKKLRNTLKGILFYDTGTFIIIKGNRFFFFLHDSRTSGFPLSLLIQKIKR